MTTLIPAGREKECRFASSPGNRLCPFDVEDKHDRCIFHLSVEQKKPERFWQHMASYLYACYEVAGTKETSAFRDAGSYWFLRKKDDGLVAEYKKLIRKDEPWYFVGFTFPAMDDGDDRHNFRHFVFPAVDFTYATFHAKASFLETRFHGKADFTLARFADKQTTTYFSRAKFLAGACFFGATFNAEADFSHTEFGDGTAVADFQKATFNGNASFSPATFGVNALFSEATFNGKADFSNGMSKDETTMFSAKADFSRATFGAELSFERAILVGERVDFRDADFFGQVDFRRTTLDTLLVLDYVYLRNQMLFDGTRLDGRTKVLLWGLNFVHGTSNVSMEKGCEKGRIVEPAGQVVFRDISANMNRVSFLHTDILTDRLLIRFSNVKWEADPHRFIFDAPFAFYEPHEWQAKTGLPEWAIYKLPELFFADRTAPGSKTPEKRQERKLQALEACKPLVRQDVERIAREIRLSTEKYGNYPDAGNYYVAEMNFRRARLPRRAWLKRPAMWFYWLVSRYGESPTWAGLCLLVWLALASWAYMIKGFGWEGGTVRRTIAFDFGQLCPTLRDFVLSVLHTFPKLVPFWSRPGGTESSVLWTAATAGCQTVFYAILTLFLLAIRRRFRR